MRVRFAALVLVGSLAGCTLVTDAGDRQIIERLDLDYDFIAMQPHAGDQLDVALVASIGGTRSLAGRARIILPQVVPGKPYPTEHLWMSRLIDDHRYELLFYVDNDLNYDPAPAAPDGARPEHIWVRELAQNGEGAFEHLFVFQDFKEDYAKGADFVLEVPSLTVASMRASCLSALLDARVTDALHVRIVFAPGDERLQVGHFATHRGNGVPLAPVRLEGIADVDSLYGVEVLVDGVRAREPFPIQATAAGATIAFRDWFPAAATDLDRCLALP